MHSRLQRYVVRVNSKPHGEVLSSECQSTVITGLMPGQQVAISLASCTDDLLAEPRKLRQIAGSEVVDSGVESSSSHKRESPSSLTESARSIGPSLLVSYDCFVKRVRTVCLEKIACCSAWVSWTVEDDDAGLSYTRVEPESFHVSCLDGEELVCQQKTSGGRETLY